MPYATPESEVAALIAETLNLDIEPSEIQSDAPLYGERLGLDSIDMLELSLAISKKYGFQMRSDDEGTVQAFSSLHALTRTIDSRRVK
jgi:acyl carrier protein